MRTEIGKADYPLSIHHLEKPPILLAFDLRGHIFDLRHFAPWNVHSISLERDNALDVKSGYFQQYIADFMSYTYSI